MNRFRKKSSSQPTSPTNPAISSPPTPTSLVMEYIKQEVATFYPRVKDRRALAASSSAIALSIASSFCNPTDVTLNEPASSNESAWRAAYGAARVAIEIANESSDLCLPLKALVGALSVLIKNYDQTTANADQIRDIEGRVESLSGIFASPACDQDGEEIARREVLRKKLAGIVAELMPLAEQHGIMKFLNNTDHANILSGFVQHLAYAVTDYQTSLQQSIHEKTKRIDGATNRIEDTTSKIDRTARMIRRTTDKIDDATDRIDGTANKIAETTQRIDGTTKKIDESAQNIIEAADHELLGKLNPVHNAGYQAGHHNACLHGTRESVLDGIMRWAKDPQDRHVFWLNGLAGTGKSTIAQTFSEMAAKLGILGASFFCSRDYLDRKELNNIFPTLAHQLSCRYPAFRRHMVRIIKQNPSVASNSLISQLEDLIAGPLSSSGISCVIVVDALDECVDDQPASAILSVLGRHVKKLPFAKFFITGRPEPRIRTGFRLPLLEPFTQIFLLHEVRPFRVDEDIRLYLQEKLIGVVKRRSDCDLSHPWPDGEDLTTLTKKSSGLFIFASTLVRFIGSEHHEPNERLQLIVTESDRTSHEGRAGIDPLYAQILAHAFSDVEDDVVFTNLRRVLGAVVVAFNPLSRVQIAGILDVSTSLITRSLRHLHSILVVPTEDSKEIRVFHKSFPDFLQNRDRCSDQKFFIESSVHHGDIALDCLQLLKKLRPNPCNLPDFVMNRDVPNIPELLEDKVGGATRYACGYWAMHVRSSPTTNDYAIRLIPSAIEFFKSYAVPWVEVMSLENRLEGVIHSIYELLEWLGMFHFLVPNLRNLAEGCLRFTMHFFHPIQQSASHIYHSALPLSPTSFVFHSRTLRERTRVTAFHKRPDTWGAVVRTITASSKRFTCMTTFGHRIAAACDDGTMHIYDSVTGVLRLTLNPINPVQAMRGSPEGFVLFCAHYVSSVTVWDMQTGGLIHTFTLEWGAEDIALSLKGRYLACRCSDGSVDVRDVANTVGETVIGISPLVTHFCWLEPEERLAVSIGVGVQIWDVIAGRFLHGFKIEYPAHRMVYSQKFDQLAIMASFTHKSALTIVNVQMNRSTRSPFIPKAISCFTFSQTTEELVCGVEAHGLHLFNVSTQCWRHIEYPDTVKYVSSLQNGTLVANFVGSGIQLLSLDGEHTSSQQPTISASAVRAFDQGKIIAIFSTNRDQVIFLETATMSPLLKTPDGQTRAISADLTNILCASLENHVVIYCFEAGDRKYMQSHKLNIGGLKWNVEIGGLPSIGEISPSGAQLVTFHKDMDGQTWIWVFDARNGQLKAKLRTNPAQILDITFDSETVFYFHHGTHRAPYLVTSSHRDRAFNGVSPTTESATPSHTIIRRGPLPSISGSRKRYYDVNDAHEWVISDSKKICWIPPGYIGSVQPSYCWAGHSLIMVGQDGTLRKLTFREPI